jgi:hypothetical protein
MRLFKRLKGTPQMRPRDPEDASFISRFSEPGRFHSLIPPAAINIPGEKIG